jgi:hypothetical protein
MSPNKTATVMMAAMVLTACAAGSLTPISNRSSASGSGGTAGGTGGVGGRGGAPGGGGEPNDAALSVDVNLDSLVTACPADSVYMLTWSDTLYRFDPSKLTFAKIGQVSCFPSNFSAFSMAVDRQGVAWIQGSIQVGASAEWYLYRVSTTDATCSGSIILPGVHNFETAGGGETFVASQSNPEAETLYSTLISGFAGSGSQFSVSTIDTTNGSVLPVGQLNSDGASGMSLTGTGDARLFAAESPTSTSDAGTDIVFTERDPATAAVKSTKNVTIPPSYIVISMTFWGGDFWFFLRPAGAAPWMVGRYQTTSQSFNIVVNDVAIAANEPGLGITAVGISTCAPLVPPK